MADPESGMVDKAAYVLHSLVRSGDERAGSAPPPSHASSPIAAAPTAAIPSLAGNSPAHAHFAPDPAAASPREDEAVQRRRHRRFVLGERDAPVASPDDAVPRRLAERVFFCKKTIKPTGQTDALYMPLEQGQ
ncbi:unnamed protein product [Urochloa humidicola]